MQIAKKIKYFPFSVLHQLHITLPEAFMINKPTEILKHILLFYYLLSLHNLGPGGPLSAHLIQLISSLTIPYGVVVSVLKQGKIVRTAVCLQYQGWRKLC